MKTSPKRRKRTNQRNEDQKSLGEWEQGETTINENDEMENSCFVSMGETREIRSYNCLNCNYLQNSLDMVSDEL